MYHSMDVYKVCMPREIVTMCSTAYRMVTTTEEDENKTFVTTTFEILNVQSVDFDQIALFLRVFSLLGQTTPQSKL